MKVLSRRQIPQLSKRQSRCNYFLEERFLNYKKDRADESTFQQTDSLSGNTQSRCKYFLEHIFLDSTDSFFLEDTFLNFQKTKQMQVFSRRQISELSKSQSRCKYFLEDRIFIGTKCRADTSTFWKTDSSTVKKIEQMKVLSRRQIPQL